jgi:hypothetical protein
MKNKEVNLGIVISSLSLVLGLSSVAIGVISLLKRDSSDTASQCDVTIGTLAILRRN